MASKSGNEVKNAAVTGVPPGTIRIIYITPGGADGRGGMGRMARYLLAEFRSYADIDMRVLDSYGPGPFWKMPFYFLGSLIALSIACVRGHVDVTHIHMAFGGSAFRKLVLLRVAGLLRVPTILHLHGSEFAVFCERLSPRWRAALISSMGRAARIVVIGTFWRQFLVQDLGIDAEKVAIVANGVPLPAMPSQPSAEATSCRIVYLGALGRRKGTSDLLEGPGVPPS